MGSVRGGRHESSKCGQSDLLTVILVIKGNLWQPLKMHVQRIHYGKVMLMGLIVTGAVFLVASIGETSKNTIDVELAINEEVQQEELIEDEDQARTSEQSLAIAQLHTCPTCLGRDLCTEISQGFLTVSMFGKETTGGTEYQGMLNGEEQLAVFSPSADLWDSWDQSVCKNSSQWKGCLVGEAAKNSFLYWSKGDAPFLRKMFTFGEKKDPSPLTACATRKLATKLQQAFDENRDNTVTMEEKAVMLTTIGVSPGIAALKVGATVGMASLPRYIGACGRLVLSEGSLTSLDQFLERDWNTRAELASQVLTLVDRLVSVEGWVMVVWDLGWEDFSVTKTGQVVLSALYKMTPIDRSILVGPPEEERPVCNKECFKDFQSEVFMLTPRGQPGRGCGTALLYVDMMYSAVCSSVFSDSGERKGLLHSSPDDLSQIIQECGVEEGKGGRWQAVDDLMEYLAGDLDDTTVSDDTDDAEDDINDGDYDEEINKTRRSEISKEVEGGNAEEEDDKNDEDDNEVSEENEEGENFSDDDTT